MKLKNVKKGTRVILKEDYDYLTKGMTGTVLEDDVLDPFVTWDNWNDGHSGMGSVNDYSCWAVKFGYLKRIKE